MTLLSFSRFRGQAGFTLIELLVVILILGIMSAIAVPSFLGQKTKADDACAKAMAKQMFTAAKTYQTEAGDFGGADLARLNAIEQSITANACGPSTAVLISDPPSGTPVGNCQVGTAVSPANAKVGFCVSAQATSGTWMAMTEQNGFVYRTCEIPAGKSLPLGGCKGTSGTSGTW